jgi:hypothetical protein
VENWLQYAVYGIEHPMQDDVGDGKRKHDQQADEQRTPQVVAGFLPEGLSRGFRVAAVHVLSVDARYDALPLTAGRSPARGIGKGSLAVRTEGR